METKENSIYGGGCIKFKSYYVVWKHIPALSAKEKDIQFKSYYVVWKPIQKMAEQ